MLVFIQLASDSDIVTVIKRTFGKESINDDNCGCGK